MTMTPPATSTRASTTSGTQRRRRLPARRRRRCRAGRSRSMRSRRGQRALTSTAWPRRAAARSRGGPRRSTAQGVGADGAERDDVAGDDEPGVVHQRSSALGRRLRRGARRAPGRGRRRRAASSAASARWRWITSQTYISVNATMPTNSVNSISPSSFTSPSGRSTLASWCRLRHSFTLKCTSGISSTASSASTALRRARCWWRAAEAAHGEVADVRDEQERGAWSGGRPTPSTRPR